MKVEWFYVACNLLAHKICLEYFLAEKNDILSLLFFNLQNSKFEGIIYEGLEYFLYYLE